MEKEITYEEWLEKFKPIKNNRGSNFVNADGEETYGYFDSYDSEDRELLEKTPGNRIWTLVNEDNHDTLLSGAHHVNRMEYYICEVATEEDTEYFVDMGCCCDDEIKECCEDCCELEHDHAEASESYWDEE